MQIKNNYDMTWDRENDDGTTEYGEGFLMESLEQLLK